MNVGQRQGGSCYAKQRVKTWGEAEICAYIAPRSGDYDEIEKVILSDPFVEGYNLRLKGTERKDLPVEPKMIRPAVRQERHELRLKGWQKADTEVSRKAVA